MPVHDTSDLYERIDVLRRAIIESGHFGPDLFQSRAATSSDRTGGTPIGKLLQTARDIRRELTDVSSFLRTQVIREILRIDRRIREPEHFDALREVVEALREASADFRSEGSLGAFCGELLSVYMLVLFRCGSPGRTSPIIEMMLRNISRRKAIELDQARVGEVMGTLRSQVTIAVIAKRFAVYLLAVRGTEVLFRTEVDFSTYGTSPEQLALHITNILIKNGIKLTDVTGVVCGGGDLGTLPDGIYVLTDKVRDESLKRLHNSSLNRGALVVWELRDLLRRQGGSEGMSASLCSPLSFSTLRAQELSSLFRQESRELQQSLKGFVKVAPLKAVAALLSEIEQINPNSLNFIVMSLDELFASVVRKIGPKILRELAAQEANLTLLHFDFDKIVECLTAEGFVVPPTFRLASRQIGTGVKEVCELLLIAESGMISPSLSERLMYVVDSYARKVAAILDMASAGKETERPHYIAITSMLALDPYFQKLYIKVRDMVNSPLTPVLCTDSLELEYFIADHLFELHINPKGDRRLHFTLEARSMKQALQVLGAASGGGGAFSFSVLLDEVTHAISEGSFKKASLVLVGADNEDALAAVAMAREHDLLDRIALIGDPEEIREAATRTKVSLSPGTDAGVEIVAIDPLAVSHDAKKQAMAKAFRTFLEHNHDFVVMKGSLDTAEVLRVALSIYKSEAPPALNGKPSERKLASSTAVFVLPDGRFFALSDAAVNPVFTQADVLLKAVENQVDVVRKIVDPKVQLKVAIITAVEKETSAIPATLLAAEVEEKAKALEKRYGPLVVEGPLSFDLATVPGVAEEKQYQGKIRGDANCLMATEINTANVLYKMLSKTMGSLGLMIDDGAIITAGPGTVPIVLTSRGDTAKTKFHSILLALTYAMRGRSEPVAGEGR